MKRSFARSGGQGYGEGVPPSKMLAAANPWIDYSQDDYSSYDDMSQFSMFGDVLGTGNLSTFDYGHGYTVEEGDDFFGYGFSQDWGFGLSGRQSHDGNAGQRGRGRGQNRGQGRGQFRGQGQQRGRGRGQGQNMGRAGASQGFRGRGRGQGQDRGRGQGQGFGQSRGQGNRGQGQNTKGRGQGQGGYGGGDINQSSGSNQQNQRGGKGKGRGMGRGVSATQVQNVSDSILGMVAGGSGQQGSKGRGVTARGRGASSKPSSLMDIVDTANERKFGRTFNPSADEETNRLTQFMEFFAKCPDRVNGIQTISNALTASRLNLQANFEAEELMFITKPLFTGVLHVGNFFLTRGLGLSKKAVKHDCYQRAVEILRAMKVEDILALEDCGKETLMVEVQRQSQEDFEAFKAFLMQKQASEVESTTKIHKAAVAKSQVAERNFPLSDKMMMLKKELEKVGIEEQGAAMVSRFDVLCFKVGISVIALFRAVSQEHARPFNTQAFKGDADIELICEIYFDGVQVGQGTGRPRKEAQNLAYKNILNRLMAETIADIVQGAKMPEQPEGLADYFEVIYKGAKPEEGNNHHRLLSLKTYPPDLNLSIDELVLIETQGDNMEDNAFRILEFSASKCGMLLEWKQLDKGNTGSGFRCEVTVNRQKTAVGFGPSKPKARNAAAAMLLTELYLSQDVVAFQTNDDLAKAIPLAALIERAEELKAEGPPRAERIDCSWPASQAGATTPADQGVNGEDMMSSVKAWVADPLRLWLEDAILEKMEAFCKRVTLEELAFGPVIHNAMRKFCYTAAGRCFLIATMKNDANKGRFITFHARGVTPQEMVKVLHLCKNKSGRYTLVRANKPISATQQAQFARSFPDQWPVRAKALIEAERQRKEQAEAERQQKLDALNAQAEIKQEACRD